MTTSQNYDAIIIGASRAAIFLGMALGQAGWRTALIEREHVGGTCINVGCTPTKMMAASARVAYVARRAADYGVHTGPVTVNLAAVLQRKDDFIEMGSQLAAWPDRTDPRAGSYHGRGQLHESKDGPSAPARWR